ncbi:MAG: TIR domain-containing protein [Verrucomicrobiota bacterium]
MADVFLSYSQRVPEPTVAVADALTGRGFDPWYDVNLLPGQFFGNVIDQAIDDAKAVVTIWSPPAMDSPWVKAETARAFTQKKLICVRTEDVDPARLPTPYNDQHVPLYTEWEDLFQALVALGVRPSGHVLGSEENRKREAQEDWRIIDKSDPEALEAFLEEHSQLAMFRRMAQKRLATLATTSAAPATAGPAPVATPEPEPQPISAEDVILRLDPGRHTATIPSIDVSADGRLLATGSEDKTVRLWSLPQGKLRKTLRPPIGEGDEGKVNAVALDPAGQWVAAGGWTSKNDDFITLFEIDTGAVRCRLGPLPDVVLDLATSPDGTRLAAGLGGPNGIRVWGTSRLAAGDPALVFEDADYGGSVFGLAFGPQGTSAAGHLAATCFDGQIRL